MKKIISLVFVGLLSLSLSACTKNNSSNNETPLENSKNKLIIKPSELSKETMDILKAVNGYDILFCDLELDDTVQSFEIKTWVYRNHEWQESGAIGDSTSEYKLKRIGIHIFDDNCDLIVWDDSGFIRSSYEVEELAFNEDVISLINHIQDAEEITLNEEITLWYKVGSNTGQIEATSDFRNVECSDGFAVTITFFG